MKKKLLALILSVITLAGFSGCAATPSEELSKAERSMSGNEAAVKVENLEENSSILKDMKDYTDSSKKTAALSSAKTAKFNIMILNSRLNFCPL